MIYSLVRRRDGIASIPKNFLIYGVYTSAASPIISYEALALKTLICFTGPIL